MAKIKFSNWENNWALAKLEFNKINTCTTNNASYYCLHLKRSFLHFRWTFLITCERTHALFFIRHYVFADCDQPADLSQATKSVTCTTYLCTTTYACDAGYSIDPSGTSPTIACGTSAWDTITFSCSGRYKEKTEEMWQSHMTLTLTLIPTERANQTT